MIDFINMLIDHPIRSLFSLTILLGVASMTVMDNKRAWDILTKLFHLSATALLIATIWAVPEIR